MSSMLLPSGLGGKGAAWDAGMYGPPRYGKNPGFAPIPAAAATAALNGSAGRLISGGIAAGPIFTAPKPSWGAIGAHFAVAGGIVWAVTRKPLWGALAGAGVAWALNSESAKRWFQH